MDTERDRGRQREDTYGEDHVTMDTKVRMCSCEPRTAQEQGPPSEVSKRQGTLLPRISEGV